MSDELSQIRAALAVETQYDALNALEVRLIGLREASGSTPDIAMMHGKIVQRRGEWLKSAALFAKYYQDFPHHVDLLYEAMLNYIDAGRYNRADIYLEKLKTWIKDLSDAHLRGMWRAATLLGNHGVAETAHEMAKARGSSFASELIARRIAIAQANASRKLPLVVSVGENCLPWMVANRWGYRTNLKDPRLQSPFNLAQTRSSGIIELLNQGIDGLIEPNNIETVTMPNGSPCPHNWKFALMFNHEQGEIYIDFNYMQLQELYTSKIASFKGTMSDRCIYLHFSETHCDPLALLDAIDAHRTNSDYALVVLNLSEEDGGIRELREGRLFCRQVALPRSDYLWFKPGDYESAEGFAFERQVADVLDAAVLALDQRGRVAA